MKLTTNFEQPKGTKNTVFSVLGMEEPGISADDIMPQVYNALGKSGSSSIYFEWCTKDTNKRRSLGLRTSCKRDLYISAWYRLRIKIPKCNANWSYVGVTDSNTGTLYHRLYYACSAIEGTLHPTESHSCEKINHFLVLNDLTLHDLSISFDHCPVPSNLFGVSSYEIETLLIANERKNGYVVLNKGCYDF